LAYSPEDVDLATLATCLAGRFARDPPRGYVVGRSALRNAVADELHCSDLEAENLVDTMLGRGFLRFEGSATQRVDTLESVWKIKP
jgi:hypothetical protein